MNRRCGSTRARVARRAGRPRLVLGAWVGAAVALVGAGQRVMAQAPDGPPPAMVMVDAARVETIEQRRTVTGQLRSPRRALLASEEPGLVVQVACEEGDEVKAGDVIARLHDVRARLALRVADAEVGARAELIAERTAVADNAQRQLARIEAANDQSASGANELDNARSRVIESAARLRQAERELAAAEALRDLAGQRLEDMVIRAPFTGRVVLKATEVGQWIAEGDPVAEIVALDEIDAWLDVPERYLESIRASGAAVDLRVDATGEIVSATVVAVIPDVDPVARLVPIRARLTNPGGRLVPGMSITGLVPMGVSRPTVTVRKDGLLRDDAGEFLYWDSGGLAAVARVRTLFAVGDRVAIEGDSLPAGAMVVVEGNERPEKIYPGVRLVPMNTSAAGPGGPPPSGG